MDALQAIATRRSTRKYADRIPERELIEKVIEAGRYAPSGGNSQTTHMIVFTEKKHLKEQRIVHSVVPSFWRRIKPLNYYP